MSDKIERIIDALRKKILEEAIRGNLVPQNPEDEPASVLLQRIEAERERLIKEKKIKRPKSVSKIFRRDGHFYESINGGEPTCIDDDIPFEIPDSWEWVRAGSIFEIWSAKRVHQSDWKNEGVPFYRTREIVKLAETGTVENDLFISNELFHKLSVGGLPHAGDLMITAVGTIGKVYIVRQEDRFYFKDASVISFRNYGGLEPNFLKSLISSSCVQNQIFGKSAGTTVDTITIVKANDYLLPIPPIEEQKLINKALTQREQQLIALLNSRKCYRRILTETPTSLRQQLIQAAIQGLLVPQNPNDEPASILLERIAHERAAKLGKKAAKSMSRIERRGSKTYEHFPDGSEKDISDDIPFDIPDSWEWSTLGLVSKNRDSERIPLSKAQRQGQSKIYDYYGASGIIDKVEGYIYDSRLLLIGEDGANLLSRSTDIAFIAEGKFWVNNHAHVLDSYKGISLDYLKHYINGISLVKYVTGSAQPKLTQDNLNAIIIPVPPTNEQLRIVEKIESILSTLAL